MDKKTIEALNKSINKWEKIVRSTVALDKLSENCALCKLFNQGGCIGCPVSLRTNYSGCGKSPYREWIKHHDSEHNTQFGDYYHRIKGCKECLDLATKELNFLISLLND